MKKEKLISVSLYYVEGSGAFSAAQTIDLFQRYEIITILSFFFLNNFPDKMIVDKIILTNKNYFALFYYLF